MKKPQDATLRNVRASRKQDAVLKAQIRRLEARIVSLENANKELRERVGRAEQGGLD